MEEENKTATPEEAPQTGLLAGKFKTVDALLHAYGELEAEFTRRSQRLKALEGQAHGEAAEVPAPKAEEVSAPKAEEVSAPKAETVPAGQAAETQAEHGARRAFTEEELSAAVSEYFSQHRVPLMGAGGTGVIAPHQRPASIAEAGCLALGYLKRKKETP